MRNSDALLELSLEKARELGHADDSVDGTRRINPLNRAVAGRMQEQGFGLVPTTKNQVVDYYPIDALAGTVSMLSVEFSRNQGSTSEVGLSISSNCSAE